MRLATPAPKRAARMNGFGLLAAAGAMLLLPAGLVAQVVTPPPEVRQATGEVRLTMTTITVARGSSAVIEHPSTLERVSITDPAIADAVPVSGTEVVINGNSAGSTTLLLWGLDGSRAAYTVRVEANAAFVGAELDRLLPGSGIRTSGVGNSIILSGEGVDARVAGRALVLAQTLSQGVDVINHIGVPDQPQVLLRVRLAEVSRSAVQNLGSRFMWVDPTNPRGGTEGSVGAGGFGGNFQGGGPDVTFSDAVNFFFFHDPSNVSAFIRALRDEGAFQSLAEPNLLAFPGEAASFLAGGEFPFPSVQGGSQQGAVTVEFREFGVRLNFVPHITNSGAIRLEVEPEVSQLDFSGGLEIQGFRIPAILSRRASTVVELQEGQTFAIAGLMDSQSSRSTSKIPFLGDIPIIGALFQSREVRDSQTELLVLVTPELVYPMDRSPRLPTGELHEWEWDRFMRQYNLQPRPVDGAPAPPGNPDADETGTNH
ncbi:type II and III secretion system protein family protein [soil metagenome]